MRNDNLQQYVSLRRELSQERDELSQRLAQINEALGDMPLPSLSAVQGVAEQAELMPAPAQNAAKPGRKPSGGGQSLREHVLEVLKAGAMTNKEVLDAVQKRGYKFSTNNPLNSLGVVLYGKNPKFNRVDGRFSLAGGTRIRNGGEATSPAANPSGKRQLSAVGRAAIAAAARKRWAKAKAAGKSRL